MTKCNLDSSVTDWIIEYPIVLRLFQELEIDYCCSGKSLEFACREQNLDPQTVPASVSRLLDA